MGIEHIPAYSPQARGRSERMFGPHQGRLPRELALNCITDLSCANRYLREEYMPTFNREFSRPAQEAASAFVPYTGLNLKDILCEQYSRVAGNDNCVSFQGLRLQIPSDPQRLHYVKVKVRVHVYPDGEFGVFHAPRKLGSYSSRGDLLTISPSIVAA